MRLLSRGLPRLVPESGELLHLDAMRFVAAIGVIFCHAAADIHIRAESLRLFVDLFFVISGYVIAHVYAERLSSIPSYLNFLVRRVARLGPLHWVTLLIFAGLGVVAERAHLSINHSDMFDYSCLPANAFLIHAFGTCPHASFNGPSWSISAEMGMYILSPLLIALVRSPKVGLVCLAGLLILLTLASSAERPWFEWTSDGGVLRALPSFMLGVMARRTGERLLRRVPAPAFLSAAAVTIFFVASLANVWEFALLPLVYTAALGSAAADVQGNRSKLLLAVAPLGQLTYSLYMLHQLVLIVVVVGLGERVLHLEGMQLVLPVLAAFFICIVLAYLSLVFFETPCRRLISGLKFREPVSTRSPVSLR